HCRWPACERPASWCDGHHLVHWIEGGETNLDNCVLLCKRHHRLVHGGGWQLIKTQQGEIVSIAPTITFGLPRGPDQRDPMPRRVPDHNPGHAAWYVPATYE